MNRFFIIALLLTVSISAFSQYSFTPLTTVSSTTDEVKVAFLVEHDTLPVFGAKINLSNYGEKLTDSLGIAFFEKVKSPDTLNYTVSANSYNTVTKQLIIGDEDISENIKLQLKDAKFDVKFFIAIGQTHVDSAKVTFNNYGTQYTNSEGITTFKNIEPGTGLTYTVEIPEYSLLTGALNVLDQDIYEEVIFAPPSYTVFFDVSLNGEPFENVEITLDGYGTSFTNKYGFVQFVSVLPEKNISYKLITERHGAINDAVTVTNTDVSVIVAFTGVDDQLHKTMNIYPNPASHHLIIEAPESGQLSLINTNGSVLFDKRIDKGENDISIEKYKSGVYLLRFSSEKKVLINRLIIK